MITLCDNTMRGDLMNNRLSMSVRRNFHNVLCPFHTFTFRHVYWPLESHDSITYTLKSNPYKGVQLSGNT